MDQRFYINSVRPLYAPTRSPQLDPGRNTNSVPQGIDFNEVLKEQIKNTETSPIQFSKHAERRLASRNIYMDEGRIKRLAKAVDQVAAKGARESLLLMDDVAYVVSVKNRMVITAVDGESMEENVFTNIDSAVIVK